MCTTMFDFHFHTYLLYIFQLTRYIIISLKDKRNKGDEILASNDEKSGFSKVIPAVNAYIYNYKFIDKNVMNYGSL